MLLELLSVEMSMVHVAGHSNHRIQKFTSGGIFLSVFASLGSGSGQFCYPQGLTTNGNGEVYLTCGDSKRVVIFSETGAFL